MTAKSTVTAGEDYPTILRGFDRLEGVVVDFTEDTPETKSRTKQAFKEECDINHIVNKWHKTGIVDHVTRSKPIYLEYPAPASYQEALEILDEAQETFESLPAAARRRFENNPHELLHFLADPANQGEALELGLIDQVTEETRPPEPVVETPTTSGDQSEDGTAS